MNTRFDIMPPLNMNSYGNPSDTCARPERVDLEYFRDNMYRMAGIRMTEINMKSYVDHENYRDRMELRLTAYIDMERALEIGRGMSLLTEELTKKENSLKIFNDIESLSETNDVVKTAWEELQVLVALYK